MMKHFLFAAALIAALQSAGEAPKIPQRPGKVTETIPFTRSESSPLPAVKRQRVAPRTLMYPEIQYKYGLFQNFLGGYIDRSLFFNRKYRYKGNYVTMTEESFLRDCEIRLSYGFDGGGSLCSVPSLFRSYEKALIYLDRNPHLAHYREFPQFCFGEMGKYIINEDYAHRVIEAALKLKHSPKINGRIPVSTYNSARMPLPAVEKLLAGLKQKYGDTFVVFGSLKIDNDDENTFYQKGRWDDALRTKYRQRIADILRVFGAIQLIPGTRRLTEEYTQITDFRLWDSGVDLMKKAVELAPDCRKAAAEKSLGVGMFFRAMLRSTLHNKKWFILNRRLEIENDFAAANRIINDMLTIVDLEMKNVKEVIPAAENDSILGWEPRMDYQGGAWHLNWKIRQLENLRDNTLQVYRKTLSENVPFSREWTH